MQMDYFDSLSLSKLEKLLDEEKEAIVRQKYLVFWHTKNGESEREIEKILRVPRSTIGFWIRKYRKEGIRSFKRKPGSGGYNRYLTKEQEIELQNHIKECPSNTKELLVFISKKYGAQYHPLYIYRLLRRLEQSLITPRKRHYKANPRSGWAFKGHIKKRSPNGEVKDT